MKTEFDLLFFSLSIILFGIVAGVYAATQVLSYTRSERNGDVESPRTAIDHLLDQPISNFFALAIARALSLALLLVVSHRVASILFAGRSVLLVFAFVAMSVAVPYGIANVVAMRAPRRFVLAFRFVLYPVIYIFRPVVYGAVSLMRRVSPKLLNTIAFPVLPLKQRFEQFGYRDGEEETEEQNIMSSVFEFGDTKVKEVMVPRIDMVAVNVNMNADEALDIVVAAGHSRVPVFDETIDKIVGVIHTKDLLQRTVSGEEIALADVARSVYFVPESKKIDDLLTEFKRRRAHIAIVVDEYGGTAGLITLEDVLEELVGEIQDEFDSEEELIKRLDTDRALCNSRVHVDDLNEALGLDLPEGDVDTLGGFLYEMIGHVPRIGESFERGPLSFKIESIERQRIETVLIAGLASVKDAERNAG